MKNIQQNLLNISNLAVLSLIEEAALSPKPGLVDKLDRGAHKDMDVFLLIKSALSFKEGFYNYIRRGYEHNGTEEELFHEIRAVGIENELQMFQATNNINTHKGANFSFGLFLSAIGLIFRKKGHCFFHIADMDEIFKVIKKMTVNLIQNDFKDLEGKKNLSYGEKLYLKYNFAGIREEAQTGYPLLSEYILPLLIRLRGENRPKELIYLDILFHLMVRTEDSNIIARGGFKALDYVKATAESFIGGGSVYQENGIEQIHKINEAFKERNLSPGGSADLLAVTIFLDKLLTYTENIVK